MSGLSEFLIQSRLRVLYVRNLGEFERGEAVFCHKCGGQLHADAEFCHKCGCPVPQDPSSSPVSSPMTGTASSPKVADSPKTTPPVESSQSGASFFAWLYIFAGVLVFGLGMHAQMQSGPITLRLVLIAQGLLFLTTGIAILGKKKSAITLVWVTAILGAIGTIARGLVPLDIIAGIATVAFAIWFQMTSQAHAQEKATQSSLVAPPKESAETTASAPAADHSVSSFLEEHVIGLIIAFAIVVTIVTLALLR